MRIFIFTARSLFGTEDDLYRELTAKGALVSSPPTKKPRGLREFGLRTSDGHRIVCGEAIYTQADSTTN
jgi:hypothetical protein